MKIYQHTKYAVGKLFILGTIVFFASCKDTRNEGVTNDTAQLNTLAVNENNLPDIDAQFLVHAAEMNLEEIQFGKLAQEIGSTEHVKELGKLMVAAHTELHNDLTGLADQKMITLPTSMIENSQEAYIFLSSISVADFDKTYADKMVRGHENAVAAFEKASENSRDTDIKNWATASLPSLRKHLDLAKECQKKCTNK